MTDKERLEEVKDILKSPGEVFFGSISEDGVVSQDVADAEPYFKWLIEQAEKNITCQEVLELQKDALKGLLEQNKRYREAIKSVRSEIKYALYSNKSEDVKRHYLQNAEREATEALEEESE